MDNEEINEKKKEIELRALEEKVREHSKGPVERFLDENPHLDPIKQFLHFRVVETVRMKEVVLWVLDTPEKEVTEEVIEKSKEANYKPPREHMPEIDYLDLHNEKFQEWLTSSVEERVKETQPEGTPVELDRSEDDRGTLFTVEEGEFICRECGNFREKIRITSEDRMICDSCVKMGEIIEGLEEKTRDEDSSQ